MVSIISSTPKVKLSKRAILNLGSNARASSGWEADRAEKRKKEDVTPFLGQKKRKKEKREKKKNKEKGQSKEKQTYRWAGSKRPVGRA